MVNIKPFLSIKTKAIVSTLTPIIISFSIICTILFISLNNTNQNLVRAEFQNIVTRHTSNFENKISNAIDYLSHVVDIIEFQLNEGINDRELMQRMLLSIFNEHDLIDSSSIYFEPNMYDGKDRQYAGSRYGSAVSGRISYYYYHINGGTAYMPEAVGQDIEFSQPHYVDAKNANTPIYTEPMVYEIDGEDVFMFVIVFPIRGGNNEFIGAVTADIHLGETYAQLQAENIYSTGYMLIANDKEQMIYSPNYEDIGRSRSEAGLAYSIPQVSNGTIFLNTRSIVNKKAALVAINVIDFPRINGRFIISVTAPISEINADGNRLMIFVITISFLILVLITLFQYFMIGKLTKPLLEFMDNAKRIGSGDYKTRIKGNFNDEFGVLKDTVNKMAQNIEYTMDESQNSLRILKNMLNGIDALIYVTVPDTGELLFMNDQLKKAFNITEDVIGLRCYEILQDGFDRMCDFCPCFLLNKNPDVPVQWEELNTITKRFYHNTDCYIEWIGGEKVHLQHSFDITDIKFITEEKTKAEETSRMKSVFLASMSHEIRTPMHGIIGFSELALDDNIPVKTRNYLSKIKTSAESLLMIINDILDVSKIEAGKMELEKIPFDISEVFKLCRMIASPKAREKGLTLFCYAEPSVGRMLLGDPTRLRQVLLNLLSNAIKFTNNGMIKMLSAITEKTDTTITMHFEIKDSGIGMNEEQIKKIFQPFTQADGSTTRKYGGTGLGLTITNSFIELMGSKLEVESNLGLGSRFCFDIIFDTVDTTKDISELATIINIDEKPVFEAEILVCEDNSLNQMVIADHLSKVGIKTVIAENGKVGVDYVNERIKNGKPFDLIFMDIHMPEMDGLDAAKKLLELNIETPIIALTANIMANDRETYIETGMRDCLPKPFVANELWSCLLKYLKPVSMVTIKQNIDFVEEEEQRLELITAFVKGNQSTISEIKKAIESGDLKLAHRMAHTLKGVSGLVGMNILSEAARILEQSISDEKTDQFETLLNKLDDELKKALDELTPMMNHHVNKYKRAGSEILDNDKALEILDKLEVLLAADSFDCLNLVDDLSMIPGTSELIFQVENLKFKQAKETLIAIKRRMI